MIKRGSLCAGLFLAAVPQAALAHGAGDDTIAQWSFDPYVTGLLLISAGLYVTGTLRLWHRTGLGRGIRIWQAGCYGTGWVLLALAVTSPLHWLGERLFTAHMIEHEIVMAAAAPLLAVSRPVGALLWALPPRLRFMLGRAARRPAVRHSWRLLTLPLCATILHAAAIWIWHAPPLFEAAVKSEALHRLQHLSFLVSALAFWWALLRRANPGSAMLHLFVTMTHMTLLGALITFAGRVLYPDQVETAAAWGLAPLEDQQLAGLIMWVPAGTVYAGAALAFAALWIRTSSRRLRHAAA